MVYKLILQTELKMLNQALYLPMLTVLLSRAVAFTAWGAGGTLGLMLTALNLTR